MIPNSNPNMFNDTNLIRKYTRQMKQMMNSIFDDDNYDSSSSIMSVLNNPMTMMNTGQGQSFISTTYMSYSSNGSNGQPQVYKAAKSIRTGPGGVREMKKSVCDSKTGVKKLAIEHHIGNRGHIVERQQNVFSGVKEENQEFINLSDNESEEFYNEWKQKTQNWNCNHSRRNHSYTDDLKSLHSHHEIFPSTSERNNGYQKNFQIKKYKDRSKNVTKNYN
ncbi:myeloid leukemia factor-like [Daktulosphaira vitifoliae]|uniref:myeloid leukemia factor-like n=1 Tax=Daktulosphaira vitifoliae TaxID=58002 RepID=UPI0021AA8D6C|nr:myeloid leukemia factor-like [Daktulosphaira vitifoliae]